MHVLMKNNVRYVFQPGKQTTNLSKETCNDKGQWSLVAEGTLTLEQSREAWLALKAEGFRTPANIIEGIDSLLTPIQPQPKPAKPTKSKAKNKAKNKAEAQSEPQPEPEATPEPAQPIAFKEEGDSVDALATLVEQGLDQK